MPNLTGLSLVVCRSSIDKHTDTEIDFYWYKEDWRFNKKFEGILCYKISTNQCHKLIQMKLILEQRLFGLFFNNSFPLY